MRGRTTHASSDLHVNSTNETRFCTNIPMACLQFVGTDEMDYYDSIQIFVDWFFYTHPENKTVEWCRDFSQAGDSVSTVDCICLWYCLVHAPPLEFYAK